MTNKREYCCYHDDKEAFKAAFGEIRKTVHIPQRMSKVSPMTVCTCRKTLQYRTPMAVLELNESQGKYSTDSNLMNMLNNGEEMESVEMGPSTKLFISKVIFDKNRNIESALRFCSIIKMALEGEYTLLEEELNDIKSKMESKRPTPAAPNTVNHHVATRCILSKRKRQAGNKSSHNLAVPDGKNIFRFDKNIDKTLQDVSKKFKPCFVETDKKRLSEMSRYLSAIPVTIWCQRKRLGAFVQELQRKALTLKGDPVFIYNKSRHYCRVRASSPVRSNIHDSSVISNILHDAKDTKSRDYSVKKTHKQHYTPHQSQHTTAATGTKTAVKCYNCQKALSTLSSCGGPVSVINNDKLWGPTGKSWTKQKTLYSGPNGKCRGSTGTRNSLTNDCQYHPGFVTDGGKWTCCQQDSDKDLSPSQQHSIDGCTKVKCHKWLYQNKSLTKFIGGKQLKKNNQKCDLYNM